MGAPRDCSHFIPLLTPELTELLATDRGVAAEDGELLRRLASAVHDAHHAHYRRRLLELKNAYAPFDPDSDCSPLLPLTADQRQDRLNDLLRDLNWVLDRAHFRHISREEIEAALGGSSEWGIRMR